jgi:hypothetical protein
MVAQNQTTYLGWAVSPSGKKMVHQAGTANFKSGSLKATLTVHFNRLECGIAKTNNPPITGAKSAMMAGVVPYVSSTQYTQIMPAPYRVIVSRKTAGGALAAASRFSYLLIGY